MRNVEKNINATSIIGLFVSIFAYINDDINSMILFLFICAFFPVRIFYR